MARIGRAFRIDMERVRQRAAWIAAWDAEWRAQVLTAALAEACGQLAEMVSDHAFASGALKSYRYAERAERMAAQAQRATAFLAAHADAATSRKETGR